MGQRLLVISPVHNEAEHLERVAMAMVAQSRPPDVWVVVDDCSTDQTPEVLAQLAPHVPFMTVVRGEKVIADDAKDRLAMAAEARAFNVGLRSVDRHDFTHIAKVDGDVELRPTYFERLLDAFARDPRLGIAGGVRVEWDGGRESLERVPVRYHVPAGLRCYSIECFEAVGGMEEQFVWDTVAEVRARMRGFETRAIPALVAVHHRRWGSADGMLRGHARQGRSLYALHYPFLWVLLKAGRTARLKPRGLSALAYVGGYLAAALGSSPRVPDPQFRAFIRSELRRRAQEALVGQRRGRAGLQPVAAPEV